MAAGEQSTRSMPASSWADGSFSDVSVEMQVEREELTVLHLLKHLPYVEAGDTSRCNANTEQHEQHHGEARPPLLPHAIDGVPVEKIDGEQGAAPRDYE